MKWIISSTKSRTILKLTILTTLISSSTVAFANHHKKHHRHHHRHHPCHHVYNSADTSFKDFVPVPGFVPNWYVGAHIGVSRTHDKPIPNSGDSVTQIGPGWTADIGYQFVEFYRAILAAELGFTQYHKSNETRPGVNVATTEHFASYLAGVAQYPLAHHFNVLGKLGVAYSYAKKVITATAVSNSANTYSLYYGAGISYNVTDRAAIVLQWARALGNHSTGSTDLTSLGLTYNFA